MRYHDSPVGVAVLTGGGSVGGPASVGDTGVGLEGLAHVGLTLLNELLELGHLAHFLECKDFIFLVAVDGHTGGIIATVLESGETWK